MGNGTFGPNIFGISDLFPSCVISASSPTSVQSISSADDAVVPTKGFGGEVVMVTCGGGEEGTQMLT